VAREQTKPHLLVLNQYYSPGFEATARLLHELCVSLTDEFDVTVITGMLSVGGVTPGETTIDGVRVIRVRSTSFDRSRLGLRGMNYITYLTQALRAGLRTRRRPDLIFCMTDPPMLADVALVLARRFRAPLVVTSQDVFPEVAVELGRLNNPLLVGLLRGLVHFYLARADRVVAIGETMRARLEVKGTPSERLTVIPNWVSTKVLTPHPRVNDWTRENGLEDKFVVMHSGNVGHAQNLDALVRAATFLRDLDDLAIVVIGTGAQHLSLAGLTDRLDADLVRFLPYQEREVLTYSLSAAHLHVVGLASGLSGFVVPSRLYGILSVGRPVIVAADEESETAQLVREAECGIVVPPGRPELVAAAIRDAHDGKYDLDAMGKRARAYAESEADRDIAVSRYRRLFHEVLA
jgi:glycosyltransferase involved in cell wall biosynthesis